MSRINRPDARRVVKTLAGALLAVALLGCGAGRMVEPVPPQELADRMAAAVEEELGVPATVVCEDELPAEVDAEAVCQLNTDDDPEAIYPVTATVTEVDTDTGRVAFDVRIDEPDDGTGSDGGTESDGTDDDDGTSDEPEGGDEPTRDEPEGGDPES